MLKKIKTLLLKVPLWLKVVLVLLLFAIPAFIALIYFTTQSSVSQELSSRSKEYLKTESRKNESVFNNFNPDSKQTIKNNMGETPVDSCFSISVPFVVQEKRSKDLCFAQFLLSDPKGYLVAYQRNSTSDNILESSDIQFRRQNPKDYKEDIRQIGGLTFYIYKKIDPSVYEKMALVGNQPGKITVVSLSANTNENLDSKFDTILESLKFSN